MQIGRILIITLILLVFSSHFATATLVKTLTLAQRVELAHMIVKGTITSVSLEDDPYESGFIVNYYDLQVDECLKGDPCPETLIFKQIASGTPQYREGQTYLFLLAGESEYTGLCAPIGLEQGVFELQMEGDRWVVPALRKSQVLSREIRSKAVKIGAMKLGEVSVEDYSKLRSVIIDLVEGP